MNNNPADKLAPYSAEAEIAVLGSILIEPDVMLFVDNVITAKDFFLVQHQWIYEAIKAVYDRADQIDSLTVIHQLKVSSKLDSVGNGIFTGSAYITYLTNSVPSTQHALTYAGIIYRAALRRRGLTALGPMAQMLLEEDAETEDVIAKATHTWDMATRGNDKGGFKPVIEYASEFQDKVEAAYTKGDGPRLPTGIRDLDSLLGGGFPRGGDIVLAAITSGGKTAMALQIGYNMAADGLHVAYNTMEMTGREIAGRIATQVIEVPYGRLEAGKLSELEWQQLVDFTGQMDALPFFPSDGKKKSIRELCTDARRLKHERGLDVLVVDYLQLMHDDSMNWRGNRTQEVSFISGQLKELAMELDIVVLTLAQLNRSYSNRDDKRPRMSDLKESSSIEQDADIAIFIHRDDAWKEPGEQLDGLANLIIAKNRNGALGEPIVWWKREYMKFVDRKKIGTIDLRPFNDGVKGNFMGESAPKETESEDQNEPF